MFTHINRNSTGVDDFFCEAGEEWQRAVGTWLALMLSMNRFAKDSTGKDAASIREDLLDLSLGSEALSSMELQSTR